MNTSSGQHICFAFYICRIYSLLSAKLPKWFGERPGKKPGDPESPDDEDEGPAEVPPGAEEEEEEEEEDEEEEEEE